MIDKIEVYITPTNETVFGIADEYIIKTVKEHNVLKHGVKKKDLEKIIIENNYKVVKDEI